MLLAFCGWGQEVHAAVPTATPWQRTVWLHMLGMLSLGVILMASGASTVYKSYFKNNIDLRLLDGPLFIYILFDFGVIYTYGLSSIKITAIFSIKFPGQPLRPWRSECELLHRRFQHWDWNERKNEPRRNLWQAKPLFPLCTKKINDLALIKREKYYPSAQELDSSSSWTIQFLDVKLKIY